MSFSWSWKRPHNVNLANLWRQFTNGKLQRLNIQLLGYDYLNWLIPSTELVLKALLEEDPLIRALGFASDPVSINSLKAWIGVYFSQKIVTGCFLKRDYESDVLVAIDVLYVRNYRDEHLHIRDVEGDAFKNLMKYIKLVERNLRYNPKENHQKNSCNFLTSFGIYTRPDFKDSDIEVNMIQLRDRIAKALRIEYVGSAFIGDKLQEAAKINGYKETKTIYQGDMDDCEFTANTKDLFPIKIMSKKFIMGSRTKTKKSR